MAQVKHPYLYGLVLLILVLITGLLGWKFPINTPKRITEFWLINIVSLALFATIAGRGITGLWRGVLIDERNKMSLSRLQLALWTILILSSFLTAALINTHKGQPDDPLSIIIPEALWGLMGISTASLIGSSLIKSPKKDAPTNDEEKNKTLDLLKTQGVDTSKVDVQGQIIVNQNPEDASWVDLFKGDEVGNAAHLDLGKIQMFFFTLVVWFAYAVVLAQKFQNVPSTGIPAFPDLSTGMLALLGISHAGYLANKAVPHTPQQPG
ncbi:MAG: hypothetical protein QOH25_2277 [Acidobacteriota bacterium]|jgi:hypothetical protein|nr:hypothetical protein [Acidobacteriota bacterium]